MMDLTTRYLGLELGGPLMPGASPLVDDLGAVRRLEDSGAPAIVMHSLFEEQIVGEQMGSVEWLDAPANAFGEALSYLPEPVPYALGPEEYLEQLRRIKAAVGVPVIASLNGTTPGRWLSWARRIEEAGADALELNVYRLATNAEESAGAIEDRTVEMVREVAAGSAIPLAVKLSPFYTALPHLAVRLESAGAAGLVLFNRFYQPGIDPEALEVRRELTLSTRAELPLRLRWLAILRPLVKMSLAASGGVHSALDAVQALMCGADAVQTVSALLTHGPERLGALLVEMRSWLEEREWASVAELSGCLSLERCPDPAAYERANYMHLLQSWRPPGAAH